MIESGERAPDFALPRADDGTVRFYGQVGGEPAVLILVGRDAAAGSAFVAGLRDRVGTEVPVHVVACEEPGDPDTFHDPEGKVHEAYGTDPEADPTVLVLDRNVRVAHVGAAAGGTEDLDAAAAAVEALTSDRPGVRVTGHAPVLLVPDALSPELCDRLMEVWEGGEQLETGVETTADGRRLEELDRLRKRRRDHVVTDRELLRTLTSHVGSRVIPEVQKAFAYRATRFEGFKIGRYSDADEGFFDAHRDNLSEATSHRRFALSINLNDDYEGGELRFPEYGRDRYRPAAGEALVFSGAHLHEVLPVTRGRRFVLLSFLFGSRGR